MSTLNSCPMRLKASGRTIFGCPWSSSTMPRSFPVPDVPGATLVRSKDRLAVGGARNLGLEQVKTEYVLILDADDKLLPGTVPYLVEHLDLRPSVSVAVTTILDSDTGE